MHRNADDAPSVGAVIPIDYLPGVKDSRLAGHRNWLALVFFALTSVSAITWFVVTWKQGTSRTTSNSKRVGDEWDDDVKPWAL